MRLDENGNPVPPDQADNGQVQNPNGIGAGTGVAGPTGSANPWDRETFKNDWLKQNARTASDMDAYLAAHPETAGKVTRSGKDKWAINDPRGTEYVDALYDESGPTARASWTDPGGMGGGGGGGNPSAGAYGSGGGAAGGGSGTGVYGTGSGDIDSAMHDAILSALHSNDKPLTAADMNAQFAPLDAIKQRNAMMGRNAAAERAAFQGTSVGGAGGQLDAEQNKITESLNQDESGLMASMMADQMNARRQQVAQALQFAQGEEKMALQKELQLLDNQLRQQSINVQGQQVNNQNQQFYDQFGYNAGRDAYLFDQAFGNSLNG